MTILMIGGTGQIGSLVVGELVDRGAAVRVLSRKSPAEKLPDGAEAVTGDVFDVDFMREQIQAADTVFLLNPAVPDELARSLLVLGLIRESAVKGLVYFSMMGADSFSNASRAAAKLATESAIIRQDIPTTILRPNAVFQNDQALKTAITEDHVYATPLGQKGVTLVDARDVAEIAAIELLRREGAPTELPTETIEVVGPEVFTGQTMAALWSDVLGKPVGYSGDDLLAVEQQMREVMPAASAYDLKLVFDGILREGVLGQDDASERLAERLGRPLRRYRDFAGEMLGS